MNAIIRTDLSSRMKPVRRERDVTGNDFKHFGINREIKKEPLYYLLNEFEAKSETFVLLSIWRFLKKYLFFSPIKQFRVVYKDA